MLINPIENVPGDPALGTIEQVQCIPNCPDGQWMFRNNQGMSVEYAGSPSSSTVEEIRKKFLDAGHEIRIVLLPEGLVIGLTKVPHKDYTIKSTGGNVVEDPNKKLILKL